MSLRDRRRDRGAGRRPPELRAAADPHEPRCAPAMSPGEAKRTPVHYYLFDVLVARGRDVTQLPLAERRRILEDAAADSIPSIVVPPVFDDVDAALDASRRFSLEGIVVKDPRSPYRRGVRTDSWLKVKLTQTQEVVLAGIRPGQGGRIVDVRLAAARHPRARRAGLRGAGGHGLQRRDAAGAAEAARAAAHRREPAGRRPRRSTHAACSGCGRSSSPRSSSGSSRREASCGTRAGGDCGPTSGPRRSCANHR